MIIFYIQFIIGIWLVASPWLLGYSSISLMKWNSLIIGAFLVILNIWIIFQEPAGKSDENNE